MKQPAGDRYTLVSGILVSRAWMAEHDDHSIVIDARCEKISSRRIEGRHMQAHSVPSVRRDR